MSAVPFLVAGLVPPGPLQVPGCVLWLDANQLGLSDGTSVTTWTDESTGGHVFTQATGSQQPVFHTGIINGLPALLFTPANSSILVCSSSNNGYFANNNGAASNLPATLFAVIQSNVAAGGQAQYSAIFISYTGPLGMRICSALSTSPWGTYCSGFDLSSGNNLPSGTPLLLENTAQSSPSNSAVIYQKGVNLGSYTLNAENGAGSIGAGVGGDTSTGGRYFAGYIAEIIGYNSVLSTANRQIVENYLIHKYNL